MATWHPLIFLVHSLWTLSAPASSGGIRASTPAVVKRAFQALHRGQWKQAQQHLRQLPPDQQQHPTVLTLRGHLRVQRGQLSQGLRLYREALRRADAAHKPWHLNNIGALYHRTGKLRQAIAHYSRALAEAPRYERARYNLELALRQLQKKRQRRRPPPPPPRPRKRRQRRQKKPRKRRQKPPARRQKQRSRRPKAPPPRSFRLKDFDRFLPYSFVRKHRKRPPSRR